MKTTIEMAREAFDTPGTEPAFRNGFWAVTHWELERFAALVRADERKPLTGWIAVSDQIPLESDGEVLVRMRDGRCEIAWATYWHGASNAFAQWTFRDPDEDEAPTHWMPIPSIEAAHNIKENT